MSNPNPVHSSTNLFRRLSWQTSISISVRIADGETGSGTGADRYFIQAPRYSYLPLLIPEIRDNLVELALDEKQLGEVDEKDWWLEEEVDDEPGGFAGQGACRWHWPIDLISLYSYISRPRPIPLTSTSIASSSSSSSISVEPKQLRLLLHFSKPPSDKLLMPNNIETCKNQWLNQIKEADFVRWRNTNKVTSLRKTDLDNGWDGIMQDDYDLYLRMAARVLPLPLLPPAGSNLTSPNPSRPPSTDPSGSNVKPESAYSTRAIPLKIYLPDNAPVIQEVIPPLGTDGIPTTILAALHQYLSLLFPTRSKDPYSMAFPIVQGILIPPESELAWLSACMCGADGWLRIGICLRAN
ncbi:uncharacterized protein IL334_001781 [Kwoniella shivajii]|uniref:Autophagy protein 5 n=1 Tax=Kwoniella shivajii TaxID=564305 RepID=A0ABZ1CT84_9TREE|nr:hypothetical protein IL334_001781 [Kwoniella shivajii]